MTTTSNNPLEVMYQEHDVIKKMTDVAEKLVNLWGSDEHKLSEVMHQVVIFFREYADGYHHRKEEEVLFPELSRHPDFSLNELLGELNEHHEMFRGYASDIMEALDRKEFQRSYNTLKTYCNELLDHIAAENEELFALTENLLSEKDLEKIYFRFMDIDAELGEERKNELALSADLLNKKLRGVSR